MKDMTTVGLAKIIAAVLMAGGWFYLRVMHVQGAEDVVEFCELGLTGLASHYLTYSDPAAAETGTTITVKGNPQ